MEEYLAFVDFIGRTIDGRYIYRFDFTFDPDTVWGDYFNVTPTAIVPDLQPDKNSLSSTGKVIFPIEMELAKKNYCFSMQDCFDRIIPLIFSEISEKTIEYNGIPLFLMFGERIESVKKILKEVGTELFEVEDVEKGDDSTIDALINSMDDDNDDGYIEDDTEY
jgi:hypothetical protein